MVDIFMWRRLIRICRSTPLLQPQWKTHPTSMSHCYYRKMANLRNPLESIVVSSESETRMTIYEPLPFQLHGNSLLTIFSQFLSRSHFCASLLTLALCLQFFLVCPQEGHISHHKIHGSSNFVAPTLGSTNFMPTNPLPPLFTNLSPMEPTDFFTCQQKTLQCTSLHYPHTIFPPADTPPQGIISTSLS